MFETLINQGRELLGIKPGVNKVAAEKRKSVVGAQNKRAVPVTRDKTSCLDPGLDPISQELIKTFGISPWDAFLRGDAAFVNGFILCNNQNFRLLLPVLLQSGAVDIP